MGAGRISHGGGAVSLVIYAFASSTTTLASTGNPSARHASSPPSSGRTRVIPTRRKRSATRALVASFGQVQ